MRRLFKITSLKMFLAINFNKLFKNSLSKVKYTNYYAPLLKLIYKYSNRGYDLNTHKKSLAINGKEDFKKFKFLVRPGTSDSSVFDQVIGNTEYYPLCNMITTLSQGAHVKTIIDAGANVGFTTLFLKAYFPDARIFSIEAEHANTLQLMENIKINSLKNEVTVLHNALWNTTGETLVIKADFRDGRSWSKSVGNYTEAKHKAETVYSITLEAVLKKYDLEYIDVLKIDIEGAEKELFANINFIGILNTKVKFLAIEIHDELDIRDSIENSLKEIGFQIFSNGETTFCFNKNLIS